MEEKDWNLIAQQAVLEDEAFDELYEHFFPRVYNLIYARVKNVAKILAFVASDDEFYEQPQVANGASNLIGEIFGMDALAARSAIGVNVLPGNLPVEIEAIFEVE